MRVEREHAEADVADAEEPAHQARGRGVVRGGKSEQARGRPRGDERREPERDAAEAHAGDDDA